jgi:hypothetical protein
MHLIFFLAQSYIFSRLLYNVTRRSNSVMVSVWSYSFQFFRKHSWLSFLWRPVPGSLPVMNWEFCDEAVSQVARKLRWRAMWDISCLNVAVDWGIPYEDNLCRSEICLICRRLKLWLKRARARPCTRVCVCYKWRIVFSVMKQDGRKFYSTSAVTIRQLFVVQSNTVIAITDVTKSRI